MLKLLEEKGKLQDTDLGNDFLNRTQIAQKIIARMDKWDYIKLERF
jgi:hypothetical protein